MPADDELARRMFQALNGLERRRGRPVTLQQLGEEVGTALGREPFAPSVVGRWVNAKQGPRERVVWIALARVLEVEPGWLAFGGGSESATGTVPILPADPGAPYIGTGTKLPNPNAEARRKRGGINGG
jgi:hypothetical protein